MGIHCLMPQRRKCMSLTGLRPRTKIPLSKKLSEWVQLEKERSLKYHLGDLASTLEGLGFISRQKSLVLVNGKLYLKCKLKGEAETTVVFIVPKAHRQKLLTGCHQDAGHQGQNRTASLLLEVVLVAWDDPGG